MLSWKFRGKFLFYLKKEYYNNPKLKFTSTIEDLKYKVVFHCFIDKLYEKEWIVYCKPPFGSFEHVLSDNLRMLVFIGSKSEYKSIHFVK